VIRHGVALERLGSVTTAMFDKTGTLTVGQPHVADVIPAPGWTASEVLRLAGSVERASGHLLARTLVGAAERAGLALPLPTDVRESPGRGVTGTVEGRRVIVGADRFVRELAPDAGGGFDALARGELGLHACVAVEGAAAGIVRYADRVREDAAPVVASLRALGVRRVLMLSGDRAENAKEVAHAVAIDDVRGDLLPEDKVRVVREHVQAGEGVLMVGDGTNDAPALGAATVGVALAAHGGGITAEAADVVLLADDLTRVPDAIRISRRTLRIARQSIRIGLGLSAAAMALAALGYIPPVVGAMVQEAIDVAVILNALRTAREPSLGAA
jgi:P-type E1-E2 ATPase